MAHSTMSFEAILTGYINGRKDFKDISRICEKIPSQFVPHFLNFIHVSCGKLLENKKRCFISCTKDKVKPGGQNVKMKVEEKMQISNGLSYDSPSKIDLCKQQQTRFVHKNKNSVMRNGYPLKSDCSKETSAFFHDDNRLTRLCKAKSPKPQVRKCERKNTAFLKYDISSSIDFPILTNNQPTISSQTVASKNTKNIRRIKPTLVAVDTTSCKTTFDAKNKVKNSFTLDSSEDKLERDSLLKKRFSTSEKFSKFPPNRIQGDNDKRDEVSESNFVALNNDTLTLCTKTLIRLAEIYSHCIMTCMVPSYIAELHLLIMLLLLEEDTISESFEDKDVLSSTLNSVKKGRVFAATSLQLLCSKTVLTVFNDDTLTLLCSHLSEDEEPEVQLLRKKLLYELNFRTTEKDHHSIINVRPADNAVHFKPELDDRSNFSTDRGFHSFRKQRDMFYTLLRHWKSCKSGDLTTEFIGKVRWLLKEVKSQSTYEAFLRLFIDQLLCIGSSLDSGVNDHANNFPLATLLNGDSEKFRRLENRVTKPNPSQTTSPSSWLHREFQFFKDFVTIADSYKLNIRLCDMLRSRLTDIDNETSQQYAATSSETTGSTGDDHSVTEAVYKLRILSSFYAFLVFNPYSGTEKRGELSHLEIVAAGFISKSLQNAMGSGHLLLTVPWVVQFLQFSNSSCVSTTPFQTILGLLCDINRTRRSDLPGKHPAMLSLFLGAVIGTLFEQDFVDDDVFYRDVGILSRPVDELSADTIDACNEKILTRKLIYEMHWRLSDIQSVLQYKSSSLSKRQLPKKITPSTQKLPDTANLQAKLESNFFRNQPPSLQRTVTFVSERSHSNCIKHLCSAVLPTYCAKNEAKLRTFMEETAADSELKDSAIIRQAAEQLYPDVQAHVRRVATGFIESNVLQCMNALLSSTMNESVVKVSCEIAKRSSLKTINTWLNDRLFEHFLSKFKLTLKASTEKDSDESGFPCNVSSLINALNGYVIKNNELSSDNLTAVVSEQLTSVCDFLYPFNSKGTALDSLPSHVSSVVSFLISELLVQSFPATKNNPNDGIRQLQLDDRKKTALEELLQSHQ